MEKENSGLGGKVVEIYNKEGSGQGRNGTKWHTMETTHGMAIWLKMAHKEMPKSSPSMHI